MIEQGSVTILIGFLEKYPSLMDLKVQQVITDMLIDLDNKVLLKIFLKNFLLNIDLISQTNNSFKAFISQTATVLYRKRKWLSEICPLDWIVKSLILHCYAADAKPKPATEVPGRQGSPHPTSRSRKPSRIEADPLASPGFGDGVGVASPGLLAVSGGGNEDGGDKSGAGLGGVRGAQSEELGMEPFWDIGEGLGDLEKKVSRVPEEAGEAGEEEIAEEHEVHGANQASVKTDADREDALMRVFNMEVVNHTGSRSQTCVQDEQVQPESEFKLVKMEEDKVNLFSENDPRRDVFEDPSEEIAFRESPKLFEQSSRYEDPSDVLSQLEGLKDPATQKEELQFLSSNIDYLVTLIENLMSEKENQVDHLQRNMNFIVSSLCFPNIPYLLQRYLLKICAIMVDQLKSLDSQKAQEIVGSSNAVFSLLDLFKTTKCYRTKADVLPLLEDLTSINQSGMKRVSQFLSIFSAFKIEIAEDYPGEDIESDLGQFFSTVLTLVIKNMRNLDNEKRFGDNVSSKQEEERRQTNVGYIDCLLNLYSHLNYSMKVLFISNIKQLVRTQSIHSTEIFSK
jgi:hypothetical protein